MSEVKKIKMYIGGEWLKAQNQEWIESRCPYTGEIWAKYPKATPNDATRAVKAAYLAFKEGEWQKMSATRRGELIHKLGDRIAENAEELAQAETMDNGKTISDTRGQMAYIPQWYYYFAGLADKIEGRVLPTDKSDMFNFTRPEPLGVILAVTSWNSPLLLATQKLAPALAAGNTIVLKPSEYASASSLILARLAQEAGFPPGVINVITGFGSEIGETLTSHPNVAKIAFTGGNIAGEKVYKTAAKNFKGAILELGGKSPNIVFEDAVIEDAVKGIAAGIFAASGQTCVAGSRLLVHQDIHDEVVSKLIHFMKEVKIGDPMSDTTQIGPISTPQQFDHIMSVIERAKQDGANCVMGGNKATFPDQPEAQFIVPTIFTSVTPDMHLARTEVFGPVLAVISFKDEQEAIEIANDSEFGLAAGIWTQSMPRALKLVKKIEAGTIWINTYRVACYMTPFGGYKKSGIGRENGIEALQEYLQTKSVWISYADGMANPFVLG